MSPTAIPYVDLAAQHAPLRGRLLDAVARVLDHGQFILGEEVQRFERAFADLCGTRYAVGLNSGTDALVLALRVLGIGPGDEVITVPNSFVASTSCIRLLGATPVFVDVRQDYTIDVDLVEAAITPRTRAILPVHLTGRPCDMDALMEVADRRGVPVVEDCAQAVMASYGRQRVGAFGKFGCFSLHPLKTLNACGDGGVLTTSDPELYDQVLLLRNIGLRTRDDCVLWAGNSRLDSLQAALLLVKLEFLAAWTEGRRRNAALYRQRLEGIAEIAIPDDSERATAVYHTFVVQAERRDDLRRFLAAHDIGTAIHYPVPIHLSRAGRELGYGAGSFPVAEAQAAKILSLPVYPELTELDLDRVCRAIETFYRGN